MSKLRKLLLIIASAFLFANVNAQYSRQQAVDYVLNNIIGSDTANVDVYAMETSRSNQDSIALFRGDKLHCPFNQNWVFFIDDIPAANWLHDCRYLFINASTLEDSIISKKIHPENWQDDYEIVNQAFSGDTINISGDSSVQMGTVLNPNQGYYAVIICGIDQKRYWHDISAIYNTLIKVYGYTKENIYVHYYDGNSTWTKDLDKDGNDDIDYTADKLEVRTTFKNLSGEWTNNNDIPELGPENQLFVFIDGHGDGDGTGNSHIYLNDDVLYDYTLANLMENIKCSQMVVMLEPCFCGGFIDDLSDYTNYSVECKNRSIHTAASASGLSYAEMHITWEGNPFVFLINEFVWYWNAAARGAYHKPEAPWEDLCAVDNFPWENYFYDHPDNYHPDTDGDGFVQMEEAFDYTNNFDTYSEYGYFNSMTGDTEDPQDWMDISFQEDLLYLSGIAGDVENTQTIEGRNYLLGGELNIASNTNLTTQNNTSFYLLNEIAEIVVENGSTLTLGNGISFYGAGQNNTINVDGNIQVGNNASFNKIGEISLNNYNLQTTFNLATFSDTSILINYGQEITIDSSSFNDCFMAYFYHCDLNLTNTDFISTGIYAHNPWEEFSYRATVDNCEFSNSLYNTISAIEMMAYDEFYIEDNEITGYDASTQKGIEFWYSGEGASGNQNIKSNTIYDNSTAILLYNSTASVAGNNIYGNDYGVKFESRSNVALLGDPNDIQYITDNDSYEVYASEESFPWYFRYNEIIDEDNTGNPEDPLVYHNADPSGGQAIVDVRYNCWTRENSFDPQEDFYPVDHYNYLPVYCQSKSSLIPGPDEILYNDALDEFEAGNYSNSKSLYQSLIEQYNESPYSQAAVKDLFALEQFATNDYDELKSYYRTNDSIQADSSLANLAYFMANKCDVKLENWQTSIDWYENEILNPGSYEDSIYAVIDLEFLYLQIDTTSLKSISGNLAGHKLSSWGEFDKHSNYLLSLLPGEDRETKGETGLLSADKPAILLQNTPNPFTNTTLITYELYTEGKVSIDIFDNTGRKLKSYNQGYREAGNHSLEVSGEGLNPGIYFYSLRFNGQLVETKKMSIF